MKAKMQQNTDITYVLVSRKNYDGANSTYKMVGTDKEQALQCLVKEAENMRSYGCDEIAYGLRDRVLAEERYFEWEWKRKGHWDCLYILEMQNSEFVDDIDVDEYFKDW